MSDDQDRVAVPTNGRRPHAVTIEAEVVPPSVSPVDPPAAPTPTDIAYAVSPRNLAIGFGILASLAVLVAGVLRRRTDR